MTSSCNNLFYLLNGICLRIYLLVSQGLDHNDEAVSSEQIVSPTGFSTFLPIQFSINFDETLQHIFKNTLNCSCRQRHNTPDYSDRANHIAYRLLQESALLMNAFTQHDALHLQSHFLCYEVNTDDFDA